MKSFLIKYILIGTLVSIAIVFVVPQVVSGWHEMPQPLQPITVASYNDTPKAITQNMSTQDSDSSAIDTTDENEEETKEDSSTEPEAVKTAPIIKRKLPTAYWGVIKNKNTPAFNSSGKFLRSFQPGDLVDIIASKNTKAGLIHICNVYPNGGSATNVLIQRGNIQLKSGAFRDASSDDKNMMTRMGEIIASISTLEKIEQDKNLTRNPHAKEYLEAKSVHKAYWKEVLDLKKKRDSSVGNDQMKYSDMLQKMKGKDVEVGQKLEAATLKYEAWNSSNAPPPSPQIMELNKELAEISVKLRTASRNDG